MNKLKLLINKTDIDLFNISIWFVLYYVIQFGFSPILFYLNHRTFLNVTPASFEKTPFSLFLVFFGLLFFVIGNRIHFVPFFKKKNLSISNFKVLKSQAVFCMLLAIFLFVFLIVKAGGISVYLDTIYSFRVKGMVGKGIYYYVATGLLPMLIIWLLYQSKIEKKKEPWILIAFLLLVYLVSATLLGFRGVMVSFFLSVLFFVHHFVKKINLKLLIGLGLFLYLFIVFGSKIQNKQNHNYLDMSSYSWFNLFERSNGLLVLNQTLEKVEQKASNVSLLDAIKETFTIVIPKAIWKGKPEPINRIYSKEVFDVENTNISPTILGYIVLLLNNWLIAPCMFLIGLLYKVLKMTFEYSHDRFSIFNLWYIVAFPSFVFMVENPQIAFNQMFMSAIAIVMLYLTNRIIIYVTTLFF